MPGIYLGLDNKRIDCNGMLLQFYPRFSMQKYEESCLGQNEVFNNRSRLDGNVLTQQECGRLIIQFWGSGPKKTLLADSEISRIFAVGKQNDK